MLRCVSVKYSRRAFYSSLHNSKRLKHKPNKNQITSHTSQYTNDIIREQKLIISLQTTKIFIGCFSITFLNFLEKNADHKDSPVNLSNHVKRLLLSKRNINWWRNRILFHKCFLWLAQSSDHADIRLQLFQFWHLLNCQ